MKRNPKKSLQTRVLELEQRVRSLEARPIARFSKGTTIDSVAVHMFPPNQNISLAIGKQ